MRLPVVRSAARSAIKEQFLPPPLKGWNARDPFTAMKAGYALRLDNWICRTDGLHLRPGQDRWLTGLNGSVQTLFSYAAPGIVPQLFCATPSAIYSSITARTTNILTNNVTLTPVVSGLTSGVWSFANHTNAGVSVLMIANGKDGVRVYNGTSWSTAAITSGQTNRTLDPTKLTGVIIHQRRAWFIEAESLRAWYLDQDAIAGPARCIDMAPLCKDGGELVAIASETPLGGRSVQDRIVAVTSNGEMLVYDGQNPAMKDTWSWSATYDVPSPIGARCFLRYGGDLLYASVGGVLPVSGIIAKPDPDRELVAITDDVRLAFDSAARAGVGSPLWTMVDSETLKLTLINAPTDSGSVQFVKPADGGWSAFVGLNATSWVEVDNDLYFGKADGSVWRLAGNMDDGQPITAYCVEAYSKFSSALRKVFKRIQPLYDQPSRVSSRMQVAVNYAPIAGTIIPPTTVIAPTRWSWSSLTWLILASGWTPDKRGQVNTWRGLSGNGTSAALIHAVSATGPVVYTGSSILFEVGGPL